MIRIVTDETTFRRLAADAPTEARIPVAAHVDADPLDAYRRLRGDHGVFSETTGGQDGWGYFATDPERVVTVGTEESAFDALRETLAAERLVRGDCAVPSPCGLFGWLSYDAVRELEPLPDETTDERARRTSAFVRSF
ncbi:hypothetical protein BRD20_04220 [Halobacteriales archaeon SW_8_65_20]|nr:MAG: hypothetical protein BRD20_04220 [Halobacteriales archaeon SW_8_65_20]